MKNPVFDKDLTTMFRNCESTDLDSIVQIILAAPSQTLSVKPDYRTHAGDHKAYTDEIVYEIQSFGGNSLANLLRGHGVSYAEMVGDVAKKLGLKISLLDTTKTLEEKILLKIIRMSYDQMDESERLALADLFNLGATVEEQIEFGSEFPEEEIGSRLADGATSLMGDRIQHAVDLVAHSARIRQSVRSIGKAALTKVATISLGGPISWVAALGQGLYELFGPSYSTALALVSHIALLRLKYDQIGQDLASEERAVVEESFEY